MIDPVALKAEITGDPANLGYAALVSAGNHTGIAALLNADTGPGAASIALPTQTRDLFLSAVRPAYLSLPNLSATSQAKWDRILAALNTSDTIVVDATTQALLAAAVSDGVLTQAQADAAWNRTGSRAEVLWGAGTTVGYQDVGQALRS